MLWLRQLAEGRRLMAEQQPARVRVLRPYADYLEDMGLDHHSASVVRDGGFFHLLTLRWHPGWDAWTAERVDKLLGVRS